MNPNHEILAKARDSEDWQRLYKEAVPLARYTIRRLLQEGALDPYYSREDLMQEASLAAFEAARTWNPIEGAFSTWISRQVRWAVAKFIGREVSMQTVSIHGVVRGGDGGEDELVDFGVESKLQYKIPPGSFEDPATQFEALDQLRLTKRLLLRLRNPMDIEMLVALYGLNGETKTHEQYAQERGIPIHKLRQRLRKVLKFLATQS